MPTKRQPRLQPNVESDGLEDPEYQWTATEPPGEISRLFSQWLAISGVCLGVFIFAVDVYIVNLALPVMVPALHANFATIQWVVLSYLLAIAIFVLTISKLGDLWNKKWLYIIGLIVFTISSLLCGLSPSIGWLIAFRFLQGIGAACLSGLGTAIVVAVFPPEQRGLGLGLRAAVYGLGISLGPTIGGQLLQLGDWPLIFWVNVPVGLFSCWLVAQFVPSLPATGRSHRWDGIGMVILTLTLTCFTLAITLCQNTGCGPSSMVLLALSGLGFLSFLGVEARQTEPLLNLRLFRSLNFSLGLMLRFISNFVIAGVIFILPFFLQLGHHYSADQAGLLLAVSSLVIVITAPLSGMLSDRFGTRIISLLGLGLMVVGCWIISLDALASTLPGLIAGLGIYGLGVGMFQSPNNSAVIGATPKDQVGLASGLLSLSRILGQMVGVPLVSLLFSLVALAQVQVPLAQDVINASPSALILATQTSFQAMALLLVVLILVSLTILGIRQFHLVKEWN